MRSIALICPLICALFSPALAWETDNVTCRYRQLRDVASDVDKETNKRITEVLKALEAEGCDQDRLFTALSARIAAPWMGNLETWAERAPIDKCVVPVKQSVYRDFTLFESPVATTAGINHVININGHHIGVDKLSHFMTEGYDYYKAWKKSGKIEDALAIGKEEEEGGYGLSATGIKSYADMAANYHGFLFWKSLTEGDNPYIVCENGKWAKRRPFRWSEFVNASFDESINCNEYKTRQMQQKVDDRTKRIVSARHPLATVFNCPLDPAACGDLSRRLQPPVVFVNIVHESCRKHSYGSEAPAPEPDAASKGGRR